MSPGGATNDTGREDGALQQDGGCAVGDPARLAAGDSSQSKNPLNSLGVGNDGIAGRQLMLRTIEGGELLPLGGHADAQCSRDRSGVKGMKRLSRLEHHEIGDVDDVVDRTQSDGFKTLAEPLGTGGDLHTVDAADAVEGGGVGSGDGGDGSILFRGRKGGGGADQFPAAECSGLAGDAKVTEPVGTVRRDLDLKDLLGGKQLGERCADRGRGIKNEQAHITLGPLAETQFLGTAHHPLALDATELADLDLEIPRHDGAGLRERHLVPDLVVLGSADDLARRSAPVIDLADAEAIGVGMLDRLEDPGGDHLGRRDAVGLDGTHLQTRIGQDPSDLGGRLVGAEMFLQPGKGNFHAVNRERKRRSFSVSIRMSETPVRFMARRSRPKPKAKPLTFSGS